MVQVKQLVGGTELEDSQKQRFHISRSFSSDTCQGNRQNDSLDKCQTKSFGKYETSASGYGSSSSSVIFTKIMPSSCNFFRFRLSSSNFC